MAEAVKGAGQDASPPRVLFDRIPPELRDLPRWIVWRREGGRKLPYVASSRRQKAKINDPSTWRSLEEARAALRGFDGVGFAITPELGYAFVDLDGCRKGDRLVVGAKLIVDRLASYTEVSQSGAGVHIIARGRVPDGHHLIQGEAVPWHGFNGAKAELAVHDKRFVYLTGHVLDGRSTIEERQDGIEFIQELIRQWKGAGNGDRPEPLRIDGEYYDGQERHRRLYKFVATLRDNGWSQEAALIDARAWDENHDRPPLGEASVRGAVEKVYAGGEPSSTPSAAHATLQHPPDLARSRSILDEFVRDLHRLGVVGEDRIAKLCYLTITSRRLSKHLVSLVLKGQSASGKSHVIDQTLRFFPTSAYIEMTGMSEHALVYMKDDFAHRTIVVFEAVALREKSEKAQDNQTAYFVRSLLSEGRIRYPVTQKTQGGGFVTKVIEKDGPTNIILSTTSLSLHPENETRMLSLSTNDSREQTAAVLLSLASGSAALELSRWWELQEWLVGQESRVVVPYAEHLARAVPPVAVRLRRDFGTLLGLIQAHALLHQTSRPRDPESRVEATAEDYAVVRDLVAEVMAEGVEATVPPLVRETVLALPEGETTTAAALGEVLGIDKATAYRRVAQAVALGYAENLEERRGRPGKYRRGRPLPDAVRILPDEVTLHPGGCVFAGQDGIMGSGCTVARTSEGYVRRAEDGSVTRANAAIPPEEPATVQPPTKEG